MLEDDGIDFTADNEIVLPKHVDIIEPVHGSYNQPCEHGTRNRRASDGVNGSLSKAKIFSFSIPNDRKMFFFFLLLKLKMRTKIRST